MSFDLSLPGLGLEAARLAAETPTPGRTADIEDPARAAREFETFFLAHALSLLQADISVEAPFGGGPGEQAFRSFLIDEQARAIVDNGGIGLADAVRRDLLALQTVESA